MSDEHDDGGPSDRMLEQSAQGPNSAGLAVYWATRRLRRSVIDEEKATRRLTEVLVKLTWALVAFTAALVILGAVQVWATLTVHR